MSDTKPTDPRRAAVERVLAGNARLKDPADAAIYIAELEARCERLEGERCQHGWRGHPPRDGRSIANLCPACGGRCLFIGDGGWLTCGNLSCKQPGTGDFLEQARKNFQLAAVRALGGSDAGE